MIALMTASRSIYSLAIVSPPMPFQLLHALLHQTFYYPAILYFYFHFNALNKVAKPPLFANSGLPDSTGITLNILPIITMRPVHSN